MKFEYRYLSEERAAEIDALGLRGPDGYKVRINYSECVTNEDESIVFQKIYFARFYNADEDYDCYLLIYKEHQYILEVENRWRKELRNETVLHYFQSFIFTTIKEYNDCSSKEVLSVLKDVIYEREKNLCSGILFGEDMPEEIIYMGEKDE